MQSKGIIHFINFIKGVCIFSVILLHSIPSNYLNKILSVAWIGQAVPLFLFITAYLTYNSFEKGKKSKEYYSKASLKKMINRIFAPFILMIIIQFIILSLLNKDVSIRQVFFAGGIGPGSYYPWIYLQVWLVLPLIISIVKKSSLKKSFIVLLSIAILVEFLLSVINIHPAVYRLLFTRYIFILYLGCIMKKYEFKLSLPTITLGIISLIVMLIFIYGNINIKTLFTGYWVSQQWITSFYPMLLFIVLKFIYKYIAKYRITGFIDNLGIYSYEIFLTQMFVFSLDLSSFFKFIPNIVIAGVLYILTVMILSITPIILYKNLRKKTN